MNIAVALSLRCYALNVCQSVHELLHTLLAGLQGIVGEIYCSTIMCREYKEPDSHRRVRLLERRVVACEELFQGDEYRWASSTTRIIKEIDRVYIEIKYHAYNKEKSYELVVFDGILYEDRSKYDDIVEEVNTVINKSSPQLQNSIFIR